MLRRLAVATVAAASIGGALVAPAVAAPPTAAKKVTGQVQIEDRARLFGNSVLVPVTYKLSGAETGRIDVRVTQGDATGTAGRSVRADGGSRTIYVRVRPDTGRFMRGKAKAKANIVVDGKTRDVDRANITIRGGGPSR